jgi:hypothetical protein
MTRALSDSELARKAKMFRSLTELRDGAAQQVRDVQAEILDELDRREATGVTVDGLRITKVAGARTSYVLEKAMALLAPALLRKVTRRVVDKEAFEAQVVAGCVSAEQKAEIALTVPNAPYIRVTP